MALEDTIRLAATAFDARGLPIPNAALVWTTAEAGVATVDATGLVRSVRNGGTTVSVRAGSAGADVPVRVEQVPDSVVVSPDAVVIESIPGRVQLTATVLDRRGSAVRDARVDWHSADRSVVTVTPTAWVVAVGNGRTVVTATAGNALAEVSATVMQVVARLTLTAPRRPVVEGHTVAIEWVAHDASGQVVKDARIAWTSRDEAVAVVDSVGRVRGVGLGTTTIVAEAHAARDSVAIEVVEDRERMALAALWEAAGGAGWRRADHWMTDLAVGDWFGVTVDSTGRVTELNLAENNLKGTLPEAIGDLEGLEVLNLFHNGLRGVVPAGLARLERLRTLGLSYNPLTGPLPPGLIRLMQLTRFSFPARTCIPGTVAFRAWIQALEWVSEGAEEPESYCDREDRNTLAVLHAEWGDTAWTRRTGWLEDGALEDWHGVETDSLGRVVRLNLSNNGLQGDIPPELSRLSRLRGLWLGDNPGLVGRLPLSLTALILTDLHFPRTALCIPVENGFRRWLARVRSVTANGRECPPFSDREALEAIYRANGGDGWRRRDGWLTDLPLDSWFGVSATDGGTVTALRLPANGLVGRIPLEIGELEALEALALDRNGLTGGIPATIGNLRRLRSLNLRGNQLTGAIPGEIGELSQLESLVLGYNRLSGALPREMRGLRNLRVLKAPANQLAGTVPEWIGDLNRLDTLSLYLNPGIQGRIPAGIGGLANLKQLNLRALELVGPLPPEIGTMAELRELDLRYNRIDGIIPPEIGKLHKLEKLRLRENLIDGPLPPEMGNLSRLTDVDIQENRLTGGIPDSFSNLVSLREWWGSDNPGMTGALPDSLTRLRQLRLLLLSNTGLCAPNDDNFRRWLGSIARQYVGRCFEHAGTPFYLTQAIQSFVHPIPLIAGKTALMRVFVRSNRGSGVAHPPVRATFYQNDVEVLTVDDWELPGRIPAEINEGNLDLSANAFIPDRIIQPGVEVVIEVDPGGTLDPALGIGGRTPADGRTSLDVRAVSALKLTMVPLVWEEKPDHGTTVRVRSLTADDQLLRLTRAVLPVGELDLTAHERVWTSFDPTFANSYSALSVTSALRAAEGGSGHYMGVLRSPGGLAQVPGQVSVSGLYGSTIAHELGHNLSLRHAPCGLVQNIDRAYPHTGGQIGLWGYQSWTGLAIEPTSGYDVMSYCGPQWISDYSFGRALRYRTGKGLADNGRAIADRKGLLIWGGVNADGKLVIEPAFVVDAPPLLPDGSGPYRVAGLDAESGELFRMTFAMPETADADGPVRTFAFVLPAAPDWPEALASITLTGPEGNVSVDRDGSTMMAMLIDPATGKVRGLLRDWAAGEAAAGMGGDEANFEVRTSRGVPDREEWRQ